MTNLVSHLNNGINFADEKTNKDLEARGSSKTTRLQFILSKNAVDRLDRIKERVDPSTRTEVIRSSLQLFEAVIQELDNGGELLIKDADGVTSQFRVNLIYEPSIRANEIKIVGCLF